MDALVLDSEGQLVSGLQAHEFAIFEDEIRHQVSRLETDGPGSGRILPMVLVLVGEEAQAPGSDEVVAAVQAVRQQVGPRDQVCIFRLGKDLRLAHPFSGQAEDLVAALQSSEPGQLLEAESVPSASALGQTPFATAESRLQLARQIQRLFYSAPMNLRRTAESAYPALVQAVARALSGIQGRKTLLLLGSGQVSSPLPPSEAERSLELANAFHLAVYSQDEARPKPSPAAGGRDAAPVRRSNRRSPLWLIVHASSGFVLQPDDLASQVRRVFVEARNHYRLFYRSRQQVQDGRYRKQRLTVGRPGLEARVRTGYPARLDGMELLSQSEIEALEAIQEASQARSRAAFLRADVLQQKGLGQKVLVSLGIPSESLQFQDLSAQGRQGRLCRIHVKALLRDDSGAVLQALGGRLAIRLDDARYSVVEGDGLAVTRLLNLPPGNYSLHAGFVDELGGGGAWLKHDFRIEPPEEKLTLSPILLGRRDRLSIRGRDAAPLGVGNFVPSARRTFQAAGPLSFVVEAYNLTDASQSDIRAYLENALGARSALKLENEGGKAKLAQGSLDLSELAPGKYQLVVEAIDPSNGATAVSRAPFEVASPAR